jgi:hypothetical protein
MRNGRVFCALSPSVSSALSVVKPARNAPQKTGIFAAAK